MENNVIYVDFKTKKRTTMPVVVGTQIPSAEANERKIAFLELMSSGMVRTIINGFAPGVVLPDSVKNASTHINWSYKFAIPDLEIGESAIKGTLLFHQEPHHVTIPWKSITSIWNLTNPDGSRIDWNSDAE